MAYSAEDEKNNSLPAYDPNRAKSKQNKLAAISGFVTQNQTSNNPNVVAAKTTQANTTIDNVNKAQTDTNALIVQTGRGIQERAAKDTTGAGLAVTKTDTESKIPTLTAYKPEEQLLNNLDSKIDKLDTATQIAKTGKINVGAGDIDAALTQEVATITKKKDAILATYNSFNKALDDNALADIATLDKQIKTAQTQLASNSTTNLAEIGATSSLESDAIGLSDSLTAGKSGNVGYLQNLFGPAYNSGKFGALDSQIYGQDINKAREDATQNVADMELAKGGKANAIKAYMTNTKNSKDIIDGFQTSFGKEIEDNKKVGKKKFGELEDVLKTRFKNDVDVTTTYAASVKKRGETQAKQVDSATKLIGKDNLDRWVKNLDNPSGEVDFTYSDVGKVPELEKRIERGPNGEYLGEIANESTDVVGVGGLTRAVKELGDAYAKDPSNYLLQRLYDKAKEELFKQTYGQPKDASVPSESERLRASVYETPVPGNTYGTAQTSNYGGRKSTNTYGGGTYKR